MPTYSKEMPRVQEKMSFLHTNVSYWIVYDVYVAYVLVSDFIAQINSRKQCF